MKLTQLLRWSAVLGLACAMGRAAEIPVTLGDDPDTLIPKTLRHAVSIAQPGDVILIQRSLVIGLQNPIIIPEALNGLTIIAAGGGSAQIRAKAVLGNAAESAAIRVLASNVTLQNLAFRDCPIDFGSTQGGLELTGGTILNCQFIRAGGVDFTHVTNGRIENNRFELTKSVAGGGSLATFATTNCLVKDNSFFGSIEAGGFVSTECKGLTVERNFSTTDFYLQPASATVKLNRLKKASLRVDNFTPENPGTVLLEENECGALHARGLNVTVRKNKVSGKVTRKAAVLVPGGSPNEEVEAFAAMYIEAVRSNNDLATTGPVLVEMNETGGGVFGILVTADTGATQVTVQDNKVTAASSKGIIINQTVPVSVLRNTINRCGNKPLKDDLSAGLHLRGISTPDVLVEGNVILKTRGDGAAILVGSGSPRLKNNTVSGGKCSGLTTLGTATPIIEGNTIFKTANGGVILSGTAEVNLANLTVHDNGIAGIIVEPGARLRTLNATIETNRGAGIIFRPGAKGVVVGGTIQRNFGAGVSVEKDALAQFDRVSFQANGGAGIDLAPKGVTQNDKTKLANGDLDFPDDLDFDPEARLIHGVAEPGTIIQLFKVEGGKRPGNKKNGEGVIYVDQVTTTGAGEFAIAPGPSQDGDLFTLTATRPGADPVTSEFSLNVEIEPSPPVEAISVSSDEAYGNGASSVAASSLLNDRTISENGRFVAFASVATNLVPDDTNDLVDIFVRDRVNGTTERVNVSSAGAQAASSGNFHPKSSWPSISADGRYVAFACEDRRLAPQDGSFEYNVFVRDRQTNTTTAITLLPEMGTGELKFAGGADCSMSADGSTVAFVSISDYVPSNFGYDLFAWRRQTGQFHWVNVPGPGGVAGTAAPFDSYPRLSANGRYVVFNSTHAFVGSDTNAAGDVYLRDLEANTTEIISIDNSGNEISGGGGNISPDGRYVVFVTKAPGEPADDNDNFDVYLRDRLTGTLHWVSPPPSGGFPEPNLGQGCFNPSISADGRYVAFEASGNTTRPNSLTVLVTDIFVHDRETGQTVEVSLGEGGDAQGDSGFPCLSYDGRSIVFQTAAPLLSSDSNQLSDVYVREIAGDFGP